MSRNTAFASLVLLAAVPALAQAPTDLAYRASPSGNVVGGGVATVSGGADDRTITYSPGGAGGGASFDRPGRLGTFAGNDGENKPRWTFAPSTDSTPGREAWIVGGGDDMTVVYANPAGSPRR